MSIGSTESAADRDSIGFRALAPREDRAFALRQLRGRGWGFRPVREAGLELVRMPVYVVEARVASRGSSAESVVRLAVDAVDGAVQRLDRALQLDDEVAPGEELEGPLLPPALDPDAALREARGELRWLALGFALRRSTGYRSGELRIADRIGWPYWILHLQRGERRAFRALEALCGRRVGARGRRALAAGFVLLARSSTAR